MKKIICTLLLLNLSHLFAQVATPSLSELQSRLKNTSKLNAQNRTTINCLRDSMYFYYWDTVSNGWMNQEKYIYTYTSNSNLSYETEYYNFTSPPTWQNSQRINHNYYAGSNREILTLTDAWSNSSNSWVPSSRRNYTYNTANDLISDLTEYWNSGTSAWMNSARATYTYNSSHDLTTTIYEGFSTSGNVWYNQYKIVSSYSTSQTLTLQTIFSWNNSSNSWQNEEQFTTTYSGIYPSLTIYKFWNSSSSTWENSERQTFTFSGSNFISELDETWISNAWVNSEKYTDAYDAGGNRLSELTQVWNSATTSWDDDSKNLYYYDCKPVGIKTEERSDITISLYPNPTSNELCIATDIEFTGTKILSLSGQEVFNSENSLKIIPLVSLENGIYFIQLTNKNGTVLSTKKFIKN